ncbi:MAG TPA: nucleoside triphosphate pyrophosphatase [Rhizomicrobium sp.]|nr:nucleoside triphosphate pyrophosphatase [Rhizomicrobium sp.]
MNLLILASASVSRARLLTAAGLRFRIIPADIDEAEFKRESATKDHDAVALAHGLAVEKASSVARTHPEVIVLGADQILSLDGKIVSKCSSGEEAASLLRRLRGRTHELVTAAVLARGGVELWSHVSTSRMTMRMFSDGFLQDYLACAGTALVQSVGCYELEGLGVQLFDRVEGDFFAVLGLPLIPVLAALREQGVIAR